MAGSSASPAKTMLAPPRRQLGAVLEEANVVGLHAFQLGGEAGGESARVGKAAEAGEARRACRGRRAASGSARRRSSAGGARRCAGSDRPRPAPGAAAAVIQPRSSSRASAESVSEARRSGWRPPAISCWVCTKNSISRMPPRPTLMLWPATRDGAEAAEGMDLPLHGVDVGDGGEVEVLAPDEGRQIAPGWPCPRRCRRPPAGP